MTVSGTMCVSEQKQKKLSAPLVGRRGGMGASGTDAHGIDARDEAYQMAYLAAAPPRSATLFIIDDARVNPSAAWRALGSPDTPNAKQLAALMAASRVKTASATPRLRRINATCTAVNVTLVGNAAVVVAFDV